MGGYVALFILVFKVRDTPGSSHCQILERQDKEATSCMTG